MLHRVVLATAKIPNTNGELKLIQSGKQFSIWISGPYEVELMNSFVHGSEELLAEMACTKVARRKNPTVLIGGMGMGFTLAAALKHLLSNAKVIQAELVPEVVEWNRGPLGECTGYPLQDKRVEVVVGDVGNLLRGAGETYDAILLDVDNGPQALTTTRNNWLYSLHGLVSAKNALKLNGILAVWSVSNEPKFTERLEHAGFKVTVEKVRTNGKKGSHHVIWMAVKG